MDPLCFWKLDPDPPALESKFQNCRGSILSRGPSKWRRKGSKWRPGEYWSRSVIALKWKELDLDPDPRCGSETLVQSRTVRLWTGKPSSPSPSGELSVKHGVDAGPLRAQLFHQIRLWTCNSNPSPSGELSVKHGVDAGPLTVQLFHYITTVNM